MRFLVTSFLSLLIAGSAWAGTDADSTHIWRSAFINTASTCATNGLNVGTVCFVPFGSNDSVYGNTGATARIIAKSRALVCFKPDKALADDAADPNPNNLSVAVSYAQNGAGLTLEATPRRPSWTLSGDGRCAIIPPGLIWVVYTGEAETASWISIRGH